MIRGGQTSPNPAGLQVGDRVRWVLRDDLPRMGYNHKGNRIVGVIVGSSPDPDRVWVLWDEPVEKYQENRANPAMLYNLEREDKRAIELEAA